jgi:hypothetical protein
MTGHRPFSELTKGFSPERKARVEAEKKRLLEEMGIELSSLPYAKVEIVAKKLQVSESEACRALIGRIDRHEYHIPEGGSWSNTPRVRIIAARIEDGYVIVDVALADVPEQIAEDIKGRIKSFQEGRISKEDVILNAQNTIQWLKDNDHQEEIPHYLALLNFVEALPGDEWQDPFGAWSDLPDTMLDELDKSRHEVPPSKPLVESDLDA